MAPQPNAEVESIALLRERLAAAEAELATRHDEVMKYRAIAETSDHRVAAAEARATAAHSHCVAAEARATIMESNSKGLEAKVQSLEREAETRHDTMVEATRRTSAAERRAEVAETRLKSTVAELAAVQRGVAISTAQAADRVRRVSQKSAVETKKADYRACEAEKFASKNLMTVSMAIAEVRLRAGTSSSPTRKPQLLLPQECKEGAGLTSSTCASSTCASSTCASGFELSTGTTTVGTGGGSSEQDESSSTAMPEGTPTRLPRSAMGSAAVSPSRAARGTGSPRRISSPSRSGNSPTRPGSKAVMPSPKTPRMNLSPSPGKSPDSMEALSAVRARLKETMKSLGH